jgi:hypothetical protein
MARRSSSAQTRAPCWNGRCPRRCDAALVALVSTPLCADISLATQALQPPVASAAAPAPCPASAATPFPTTPAAHTHRVDSVIALHGGAVASKSADGRVVVWDAASKAQRATWRVPGCTAAENARGRVGASPDGTVLVAGNATGEVFAFDTANGNKLTALSTGKVRCAGWHHATCTSGPDALLAQARAPVLACAVTDDCRTVLATFGVGVVARFELITVATAAVAADDEE